LGTFDQHGPHFHNSNDHLTEHQLLRKWIR